MENLPDFFVVGTPSSPRHGLFAIRRRRRIATTVVSGKIQTKESGPFELAPRIATSSAAKPFLWSVMIPCYNARPDYLAAALRSVLQQDPGKTVMQIEVIDDCSPDGTPVELVLKIAGDRVTVHREEKNLGLAGSWNRCIERAQGKWVHILHQDD